MDDSLKVVFWQNMLSPHLAPLIRALSLQGQIIAAILSPVELWRIKQGWVIPDYGSAKIITLNDAKDSLTLFNETQGYIHVFSGINSYPIISNIFHHSLKRDSVLVISESPIRTNLINHLLKLFLYFSKAVRFRRNIKAIFTMGDLGVSWFQKCGFSKDILTRFQYFVDIPEFNALVSPINNPKKVSFVFIGQLVKRKGVDNLINALSKLSNSDWNLHIIGSGPEINNLTALVKRNNLSDQIIFHGQMANEKAMEFLNENADFLILPSRYDGWGAVVNEALVRGIPVITNTKCGASSLIQNSKSGFIYNESSLNSLVSTVSQAINTSPGFNALESKSYIRQTYIDYTNNSIQTFVNKCKELQNDSY
ncbi:MAG: glycosyltransferase [Bacteroidetes bacterium]|nr:glycosyltransferase [Bacteroidota bacterium]